MQALREMFTWLFGIGMETERWGVIQIAARAVAIYVAALLLVRLGKNRFLGKNSAFDVVLAFVFGSMLSRAINGSPALVETVVAGAVMIGLHWLLSVAAQRSHRVSRLLRGDSHVLVHDGVIDERRMKTALVTRGDLEEALRLHGKIDSVSDAKCAVLERNGTISVLPRADKQPRVVEVRVESGVQVVRIEIV